MPIVLEKKVANAYHFILWKVKEDIEDLKKVKKLSEKELAKYASIKLELRKTEWLGRMFLYNALGIPGVKYLENGKPVLDAGYISISHCDDLVVMILSDLPIGIDLQNPNPKIEMIRTKFCNPHELSVYENTERKLEYVSKIWSAKEAVFKIFGENVPFADGMNIRMDRDLDNLVCELDTRELKENIPLCVDQYRDYFLIHGMSKI